MPPNYTNLLKILQNSRSKEDLDKNVSEAIPAGSFVKNTTNGNFNNYDDKGNPSDSKVSVKTLRPTNYPELTDDKFNKDKYDELVNTALGEHVNETNRTALQTALDTIPDKDKASSVLSLLGIKSMPPLEVRDLSAEDLNGATIFPYENSKIDTGYNNNKVMDFAKNFSPYENGIDKIIQIDKNDTMPDTTLVHELKHAHDYDTNHVTLPTFNDKRDAQANVEQNSGTTDDAVKAWQDNDFSKMSDLYSGNHFNHDSSLETAAKLSNYNRLQKYMKQDK